MPYAPTTPVTGLAQTGLTTPTYTLTADTAPDLSGRQHAITAIGGTQPSVNIHSSSTPFTLTFERPKTLRLPAYDRVLGVINAGRNVYKLRTRKSVLLNVNSNERGVAIIETTISLPVGSDQDGINVRAAMSLHYGALSQMSSSLGDIALTNIL